MVFVSVRVRSFPPPLLLWEIISWLDVEQLVTERVTMHVKAKVMVCLGVTTILCQYIRHFDCVRSLSFTELKNSGGN